jgi:hypothetical protein
MPPPELNLEKWRASLLRLQQEEIRYIAPTHFGIYADPEWQFKQISSYLDEVESWMDKHLQGDKAFEQFKQEYMDWSNQRSKDQGLSLADVDAFELANPNEMSSYGIFRYWQKSRQGT